MRKELFGKTRHQFWRHSHSILRRRGGKSMVDLYLLKPSGPRSSCRFIYIQAMLAEVIASLTNWPLSGTFKLQLAQSPLLFGKPFVFDSYYMQFPAGWTF